MKNCNKCCETSKLKFEKSCHYQFTLGVVMMSGALMADAAIGNVQERTLKTFNAPNTEMVGLSLFLFFFRQMGCMVVFRDSKVNFALLSLDTVVMLILFYWNQ